MEITSRSLVTVHGADAESFLQGLITNDIARLKSEPAIFTAMLSPQGKWQHDFFIFKHQDAYYLDHASAHSEALLKKLKLYRLRSRVEIALQPDMHLSLSDTDDAFFAFADPRHAQLPLRRWGASQNMAVDYHTQRVALGIPEGGIDITENETALDAGYDLLNAVSFSKGCYVGQEITARMHYKSIARKGFFQVQGSQPLPAAGSSIMYAGKTIAELRSVAGTVGIAYGRLEDVAPALTGENATCGGLAVALCTPAWQHEKWQKFIATTHSSDGATGSV
jgi:folate-binding protein YgfZ